LDALYKCDLSEELQKKVSDWLLSIPAGGVSEEAFVRWVSLNIKPDTSAPDKDVMEKFNRLVEVLNIEKRVHDTGKTRRRRVFDRRFALRAAAVLVPVLIAAGAGFLVFDKGRTAETDDVAETVLRADGGSEEFTLPDGSKVTLEEGSRWVYSSDFVSARSAKLDGEAFFEVVRDTAHPFTVTGEGLRVVVLGTAFKMKARNDVPTAEVVLVSGSIVVEIGESRHELEPGYRLALDKSILAVTEHSQVGAGAMLRITGSDLAIVNLHAGEALRLVADYYGKRLVMEEGLVTKDHLNLVLPVDVSLENALGILNRLSDGAKFTINGDAIHVSRK
jgi:ferric-dicitrate binding protein FerR (iron transport regulator)